VIEQRVKQVLEIETEAQGIYNAAVREADELAAQAEEEAKAMAEQSRVDAQAEAKTMIDTAGIEAEAEGKRILDEARLEADRVEAQARTRFDRAVTFVLDRVAGTE
jgi:vacuolar-type H+-ATPase subunit H